MLTEGLTELLQFFRAQKKNVKLKRIVQYNITYTHKYIMKMKTTRIVLLYHPTHLARFFWNSIVYFI